MNFKNIFLFLFILFWNSTTMNSQNAETLLQKMDNVISAPKDREASVIMVMTDKNGKEKIREASLKQKGRFKKLYRYTKPEKQAGIATLTLPDNVIWLYMPAFNKPMRISLLSKSQAFSGTDFSQEDMSGLPYSDRYSSKIIDSDSESYRIELIPKNKKNKYSKIILTLNKTNFYPIKMEYFDKSDRYFKLATYKYVKQGIYWYAKNVLMKSILKQHSTKITFTAIKFDQGLSDDLFLVENLKIIED